MLRSCCARKVVFDDVRLILLRLFRKQEAVTLIWGYAVPPEQRKGEKSPLAEVTAL